MWKMLPRFIELTWWEKLFARRYQSIQSKILHCHTKTILSLCQREPALIGKTLNDPVFWDQLKSKCHFSDEVIKLHEHWKKLSLLSHLNSRELISLLQNEINPLIRAYDRILFELHEENNNIKQKIVEQTKENLKRIHLLKQHVYYGLAVRCGIYKILGAKRQVDDVVAYIIKEIKALNVLDKPLENVSSFSEGMDDNQRLAVFDILSKLNSKIEGLDIRELHEITRSIPRHEVFPIAHQESTHSFRNKIEQFIEKIRQANKNKKTVSWGKLIWKWWYILAAILIYLIIQSTLLILIPIVPVLLKTLLTSVFLYSFWNVFQDQIVNLKNQKVMESLIILLNSQDFMDCQLSQTILDLEHFDVNFLLGEVKRIKSQLSEAYSKLFNLNFFERFIFSQNDLYQISKISNQLLSQKNKLKQWIEKQAVDIADRIGQEMENKEFSVNAFSRWREFVFAYGKEEVKKKFSLNSNWIIRWGEAMPHFKVGDVMCEEQYRKWKKSIEKWTQNTEVKKSCIGLHKLLFGRIILSKKEFEDFLNGLALEPSQIQKIQYCFQTTLFETLKNRTPEIAILLSETHQKILIDWRNKMVGKILEADKMMQEVMLNPDRSPYTDTQLAECYELLDTEDYYGVLMQDQSDSMKRKNRVRLFFEHYHGETSRVFHFLRFISKNNQADHAVNLAEKRRNFLNDNGGMPEYLSNEDALIFYNRWVVSQTTTHYFPREGTGSIKTGCRL